MDTCGIDVPNSRAIAKQLLTLSKDPDNQPFIVQEQGCLAGLVQYTQHDDIEVVLIATRALEFLSSHPSNKDRMREFPCLVSNLTAALPRAKEHPKIKDFVRGALGNLSVCLKDDENEQDDDEVYHDEENDAENAPANANVGYSMQGPAKPKASRAKRGEFRTVALAVAGVEQASIREAVESLVIQIDGVISVTVNPDRGHVLIGTRVEGDELERELVSELAAEGLAAKIVVPGATRRAADADNEFALGEEDGEYPDYLDEDEYEDEEEDEAAARLTRQGYSSLEARLEQQRRDEEARNAKSSRLINKMNGMLSTASFWLMGY